MKEKKLSKKLVLNKERIARLNNYGMNQLFGGADDSMGSCTCGTCHNTCQQSECIECEPSIDPNG